MLALKTEEILIDCIQPTVRYTLWHRPGYGNKTPHYDWFLSITQTKPDEEWKT